MGLQYTIRSNEPLPSPIPLLDEIEYVPLSPRVRFVNEIEVRVVKIPEPDTA